MLYIGYALVFLLIAGLEAAVMRIQFGRAQQSLRLAPGLQSHVYHARHDDGLLRGHADSLRLWQLPYPAD